MFGHPLKRRVGNTAFYTVRNKEIVKHLQEDGWTPLEVQKHYGISRQRLYQILEVEKGYSGARTLKTIPRLRKVYEYICQYKQEHDGNSPTVRQIIEANNLSTSSRAGSVISSLREMGVLAKTNGQKHHIQVEGGVWIPPKNPFEKGD